jgi:hypothetical protein
MRRENADAFGGCPQLLLTNAVGVEGFEPTTAGTQNTREITPHEETSSIEIGGERDDPSRFSTILDERAQPRARSRNGRHLAPTLHQRAADLALHAYLTTLADGMALALVGGAP